MTNPDPDTVLALSTRGFGPFRHDLLLQPDRVRMIGLFTEQDEVNLTGTQRAYLTEIRTVRCALEHPSLMLRSLVDYEQARAVVEEYALRYGRERLYLVCFDEQNMLVAARIRSELGLPGPGLDTILPFRDKVIMKNILAEQGIRVPMFAPFSAERYLADQRDYLAEIEAHVGLPFILKPVDSAGGDGVRCIRGADDFAALPADLGRAYEYEEYVSGVIFSVNIVARNQRTLFAGVTEYLVNSLQVQQGRVNADINLLDSDDRVAPMVAFAERALRALGWPDGASHLELFRTASGELVFLEVAARFKGMAGLAAMQRHYGVALVNLALTAETGIASRPYDLDPVYCFDGVVPRVSGVVLELVPPRLESEVEMSWTVQPGETIEQSSSLLANGGTFLVSNRRYAPLYRDFRRLADYQPIVYADPARLTPTP